MSLLRAHWRWIMLRALLGASIEPVFATLGLMLFGVSISWTLVALFSMLGATIGAGRGLYGVWRRERRRNLLNSSPTMASGPPAP